MEWHPFYYKGEETNIEVNELGEFRRLYKDWMRKEVSKNIKGFSMKKGYVKLSVCIKNNKRKHFELHQIMAIVFLNHVPCGMKLVIDHIDENKVNNKLQNLRIISQRENSVNSKRASKYGTGVCLLKNGKYESRIRVNNILHYLGLFNNSQDASKAYQEAFKKINNCTYIN